ncbi:uncharacterized protein LAESUDRAFT_726348, partial [Laetiporus sulphureus 93-53]
VVTTFWQKKSVEQGQSKHFITLENLRNSLNVLRTAARALPYQRFNLQASDHNAPHPSVAHSCPSQSSPGQPSGATAVQQQQDAKFTPKLPQAIPNIPQTPQIPPAPQIHRIPQMPPAQAISTQNPKEEVLPVSVRDTNIVWCLRRSKWILSLLGLFLFLCIFRPFCVQE